MDTNQDGELSAEEFRDFYRKKCPSGIKAFDEFDTDRDNLITAEEFKLRFQWLQWSNGEARRNWEKVREVIDKTGDDMLSWEEIWLSVPVEDNFAVLELGDETHYLNCRWN